MLPRALALPAVLALLAPAPARAAAACDPSTEQVRFFQDALDAWETITRDLLGIPRPALPWMLLFDRTCVYHLGADPAALPGRPSPRAALRFSAEAVPVHAFAIGEAVALPRGDTVPVRGQAFTGVFGDGPSARPFFVAALPEVWRHDPAYAGDPEDWPPFVLSVLAHELVHTLQIVAVRERLEQLSSRFPGLPVDLDDDLLQKRYGGVPGVEPTVRAEIALLYAAHEEGRPQAARELAARGLALLRARRATYFGARLEPLGALEDTFLNMEGLACWAALQVERRRRPAAAAAASLDEFRGGRKWWSQEEGLALFLLLDRFVPDWRTRVLPPELASPVALLEQAVAPSPGAR
jgi:hypothetical protein